MPNIAKRSFITIVGFEYDVDAGACNEHGMQEFDVEENTQSLTPSFGHPSPRGEGTGDQFLPSSINLSAS